MSMRYFYGPVIDPESLTKYAILPRALLAVGSDGRIAWLSQNVEKHGLRQTIEDRDGEGESVVTILKEGEFLIPGFVDTHTHAPQVPNMGSGQQYELLDWLENVTFPMESRFADINFAKIIYPKVVQKFVNSGTTTCCYYGTLHLESTKVLADVVAAQGQRALVGKCNMDRNCPVHYREPSAFDSIEHTKELIAYIRSMKNNLVQPVLTPRFAISCTPELLRGLGDIAKNDATLAIQTHISENKNEIAFTKELFPDRASYADVYDHFGLLGKRTILAHAVHLEDSEVDLIVSRGSGVSHCPTSNFNLRSGMARIGELLDKGIKVGLGTDVSGGYSPSILTAIQHASICSKMIAAQCASDQSYVSAANAVFAGRQLPIATLFYLATMGGASLCCMEDQIGSFSPGKYFDALLVSIAPNTDNLSIWTFEDPLIKQADIEKQIDIWFERFLFGGDDRNILNVFVGGNCIGGKEFIPDQVKP